MTLEYDLEKWRAFLAKYDYREFSVREKALSHNATYAFQKRFRDGQGTRYFITLWVYPPFEFQNGNTAGGALMVELNINEPHQTFEQHGFRALSDEVVANWEDKCRLFFEVMGCCYYESNDISTALTSHETMASLDWVRGHIQFPVLESL